MQTGPVVVFLTWSFYASEGSPLSVVTPVASCVSCNLFKLSKVVSFEESSVQSVKSMRSVDKTSSELFYKVGLEE